MKKNLYWEKFSIIGLSIFIIIIMLGITYCYKNSETETEILFLGEINKNEIEKDFVYLSDINYVKEQSSVGYGSILYDKNLQDDLISVNIDNQKTTFLKGILAHATSSLIYDVSSFNYDYFTAYIGVEATRGDLGNGVKFYIYTSDNGQDWTLATDPNPAILKGSSNAIFIKINIKNKKYLKLVAKDNGNNASDHSVYANAKLVKESYVEEKPLSIIKTVEEYDQILRTDTFLNQLQNNELMLLQRNFISKVGFQTLQSFAEYSSINKEALTWLLSDLTNLNLFVTGGEPTGSYLNALKILAELYQKNKSDLQNDNISDNGIVLKDLYRKMMISLSLTHSKKVCLWTGKSPCSDAQTRYEIYKSLHQNKLLENNIFEKLSVEEMRWVFNNNIDDEEIKWLNAYARKFPTKNKAYNLDPYNYIRYTFGYNYSRDIYYDELNYEKWNQKYELKKYNLTYLPNNHKLWIVFEEGAVCGGISKTGSNLNGVFGIPSGVIGQPGHAAYLVYSENAEGKGLWNIYNDVSGWTKSEKSERMPLGWGSTNWDSYYQVSYILLAQAAMNDLENYEKAEKILLFKNIYKENYLKLEEIYRSALKVQNFNLDAWYGLIQAYQNNIQKTENDYYKLAEEIASALNYYPLPMWDLLNLIKPYMISPEYLVKFTLLQKNTLEKAINVTSAESIQPNPVKTMANYLLGNNDFEIATFSFDGENAGKIIMSEKYQDSRIVYEYSLDGKKTWYQTNDKRLQLTPEQIASITSENDINIHLVGADANDIFTIDIKKSAVPDMLYNNDLENKVIGATNIMEWSLDDGLTWISFNNQEPDLTGDKDVLVRIGKNKTYLESESIALNYTVDKIDEKQKYVPISRISVESVSSEDTSHKNDAKFAIDGNIKTIWHTNWNGSDNEKYIVLKLDHPIYLSALDYVPRQDSNNGKIKNAQILVSMDNENWQEIISETNWSTNKIAKQLILENSVPAKYIKIIGKETVGNYASAAMINIYEDKTIKPTADIEYSQETLTNEDVVVKLVNPSTEITILNNGGKNTYVFKENGTFSFEYMDAFGNINRSTATVDWIDKEPPTASIIYNPIFKTTEPVTATLQNTSEEIIILNNNHSNVYVFDKNGSFEFVYQDKAGNIGKTLASVNWIENKVIEDNKNEDPDNNSNDDNSEKNETNDINSNKEPTNNSPNNEIDNSEKNENNSIKENETNNKFTIYHTGKISLQIPIDFARNDLSLNSKMLALDSFLEKQFPSDSTYFEVYFTDMNGELEPITDTEMNMTLNFELSKKIMGIYYIKENGIYENLDYQINGNKIEVNISHLGRFLIAYQEESKVENTIKKENGTLDNSVWIIVGTGIIIIILISIIVVRKKLKNKF